MSHSMGNLWVAEKLRFMCAGSTVCAMDGPGLAFWRGLNVCAPATRGRTTGGRRGSELRIDYGPGYRVYFVRRGQVLVILLAGGDKGSQKTDIRRALRLARNLSF